MSIPADPELYKQVKKYIFGIYKKNSAFRSGALQQEYQRLGGKYIDTGGEKKLKRWFNERWKDVSTLKTEHYPLYRPTRRVNKNTPTTVQEISKERLKEMSKLKDKIKGKKNLPKF